MVSSLKCPVLVMPTGTAVGHRERAVIAVLTGIGPPEICGIGKPWSVRGNLGQCEIMPAQAYSDPFVKPFLLSLGSAGTVEHVLLILSVQ